MDTSSDLALFVMAIDNGSFSAAAIDADLTAATVGKRISGLESRLGVQLLMRTTRSLVLTEAGKYYYSHAKRMVREINAIEHSLRHLEQNPSGNYSVSCNAALSEKIIAPALPEFLSKYPEINISLLVADRIDIPTHDNADLIIRSTGAPLHDYVSQRVVYNPWVLCATPEYLHSRGVPNNPEDLINHNCLIAGPHGKTEEVWLFKCEGATIPIRVKGNFGGFGRAVYTIVKAGIGIARLPAFLVREDIQQGNLVQVLSKNMCSDSRFIYLFHRHLNPPPLGQTLLIQHIANVLKLNISENEINIEL